MENIVPNVRQIIVNRRDRLEFGEVRKRLQREYESLDVLVDIVPFGSGDAQQVLEYFAPFVHHIIVISTTLVYARHPSEPAAIPANHALTQPGLLGGYVDRKLEGRASLAREQSLQLDHYSPLPCIGRGLSSVAFLFITATKN